ncbi:MAG: hypothetical protein ACRCR2_02540 [Fusobacteriaceae bacterium]
MTNNNDSISLDLLDTHSLQLAAEQMCSKAKVREMVREDIYECEELVAKLHMTSVSIIRWANEDHYDAKKRSLETLLEVDIESMLIDILAILLVAYPPHVPFELTAVIGLVKNCLPYPNEDEQIKRCGEVIFHMANCDLLGMRPAFASPTGTITVYNKYSIGGDTAKYINQMRFTPPMVCKPLEVTKANESGYLTKGHGKKVLKPKHMHNFPINLVSINKFNQTALTIDTELLELIEDKMKIAKPKAKKKYEAEVNKNKPTKIKSLESRQRDFDKLKQETAEVCENLIAAGNVFHLTHFYCGRGRTYSNGYHVDYQGNPFRKAMVSFVETAPVGISDEERSFFEVSL